MVSVPRDVSRFFQVDVALGKSPKWKTDSQVANKNCLAGGQKEAVRISKISKYTMRKKLELPIIFQEPITRCASSNMESVIRHLISKKKQLLDLSPAVVLAFLKRPHL